MLDHGLGLAAVKGFVQPAIHQQPALVEGVGDAVGSIGHEGVSVCETGLGAVDFCVAVRALHEDHQPVPGQAAGHPFQGLFDGLHCPGDHSGYGLLGLRCDPAADHADSLQFQSLERTVEKLDAIAAGLRQDQVERRPVDLERDSRHAGAGAEIEQRRGQLQEVRGQHRVHVKLSHHVVEIVDPREIQIGIAFTQQAVIGPQLPQLKLRKAKAAGT